MKKISFYSLIVVFLLVCLFFIPSVSHAAPLYEQINQDYIIKPWEFIRWAVDIIVIIVILIISVATILRVENLQFKRLLPGLIIGLIAANFSFLICRVLVDIVQIPTGFIAGDALGPKIDGVGLLSLGGMSAIYTLESATFTSAFKLPILNELAFLATGGSNFILVIVVMLIIYSPIALAILFLTLLMMARVFMIWFLVAVSPIALFSAFIPLFQGLWKVWWSTLFKWLIMGFLVIFVLKVGMLMTTGIANVGFANAMFVSFGQWVLGLVTFYMALYFVPFKLLGGGAIMGAALGGLGALGGLAFVNSMGLGKAGEFLSKSRNARVAAFGRGTSALGQRGAKAFYNPNMLKTASQLPLLGGYAAAGLGRLGKSLESEQQRSKAAGFFTIPEEEFKFRRDDAMETAQKMGASGFYNNVLKRNTKQSAEIAAAYLGGDEKRISTNAEALGRTRAMGTLVNTDKVGASSMLEGSFNDLQQMYASDASFAQQIDKDYSTGGRSGIDVLGERHEQIQQHLRTQTTVSPQTQRQQNYQQGVRVRGQRMIASANAWRQHVTQQTAPSAANIVNDYPTSGLSYSQFQSTAQQTFSGLDSRQPGQRHLRNEIRSASQTIAKNELRTDVGHLRGARRDQRTALQQNAHDTIRSIIEEHAGTGQQPLSQATIDRAQTILRSVRGQGYNAQLNQPNIHEHLINELEKVSTAASVLNNTGVTPGASVDQIIDKHVADQMR